MYDKVDYYRYLRSSLFPSVATAKDKTSTVSRIWAYRRRPRDHRRRDHRRRNDHRLCPARRDRRRDHRRNDRRRDRRRDRRDRDRRDHRNDRRVRDRRDRRNDRRRRNDHRSTC